MNDIQFRKMEKAKSIPEKKKGAPKEKIKENVEC
jgi:hypothetical protein